MTRITQFFLPAFLALQVLGAALLITAFYVRLWPLELLVSFTSQLTVILFCSVIISTCIVAAFSRHRKNRLLVLLTLAGWVCSLYIGFYSLSAQPPNDALSSSKPTVSFAAFNKLYTNQETDRYINYFKEQDIDILALQEMQPSEVEYVARSLGFEHSYATRAFASAAGTVAALISRYPFESVSTVELDTNHPVVRAVIKTPEGPVVAYSVHLPVPASPALYAKRNSTFLSLAKALQDESLPVVIGGDFNTTIFSPAMRSFVANISSTTEQVIAGNPPTCSWYGYGAPLCIRIDHIFVSKELQVTNHFIGPDLGSDHRPVIARLAL